MPLGVNSQSKNRINLPNIKRIMRMQKPRQDAIEGEQGKLAGAC
jgi:hypothetical protein